MEITIKDLYKNIDSLPKSLYEIVYNYINLLKEESKTNITDWQKNEVRKRIEFAKLHPESLVDFDSFIEDFEKQFLNEN
ncbi:hypothetical protein SAMN05660493_02303 [Epilithonimonas bovis DSM 19482]|uniref:Addiction module component n=1 Tax=Epilithonimonas bovis DSM 19482 TaxID=1121284 RepID=A0A1U7Q025_9FLAO|nr:hypothetical protein [Epilithonimonas bovis]QIY84079.1 hypothetical protein HER18_11345 [Chryseobacterium sp. NEB161]SIT97581.1 hypothetical protein SAMN05660493_02303 [Epilithonimonas bovis DSM 19482]